ncbi:MAG: AraC family transcriptional regulator [Lachnospiraceae bacterium]
MTEQLLQQLRQITSEEERILAGEQKIQEDIYMSISSEKMVFDSKKLLQSGKLISVRKHTRFIYFPPHKHNYVEVIYMCSGKTYHKINGTPVCLEAGELLFLNQNAVQEIEPAGEDDIAVNFIILPEFFDYALKMMEADENLLRTFVINCLKEENNSAAYLHFQVSDILPIQNLVENLIWTLMNQLPNKRSINQITMGLLVLQLINYVDRVTTDAADRDKKLMMTVLGYIEEHYRDGELSQLAAQLHYDVYWLSKEIKRQFGQNYTDLIQEKRMKQAAYLLTNTKMSVMEIGLAVGYENLSYFHRIFQKRYGMTPRKYRLVEKKK